MDIGNIVMTGIVCQCLQTKICFVKMASGKLLQQKKNCSSNQTDEWQNVKFHVLSTNQFTQLFNIM